MSAISDIRHRHMLFRYRRQIHMSYWKTSFRYWKCSDIDIRVHSIIRHRRKKKCHPANSNPRLWEQSASTIPISYCDCLCRLQCRILDIGKNFIPIRYNVGLRSLSPISEVPISGSVRYWKFRYQAQSDIGNSDIRLSPISLITDIGLSAYLCLPPTPCAWCLPSS